MKAVTGKLTGKILLVALGLALPPLLTQCGAPKPMRPDLNGSSDLEPISNSQTGKMASASGSDAVAGANPGTNLPTTTTPADGANANQDFMSGLIQNLGKMFAGGGSTSGGTTPSTGSAPTTQTTNADCIEGDQTSCQSELAEFNGLNAVRAEKGLPALQLDPKLSWVARDWSRQQGMMISHLGFPFARTSAFTKKFPGSPVPGVGGENVAFNQGGPTAQAVGDSFTGQWKGSAGHYANMVGGYRSVGIGIVCKTTNAAGGGGICTATQIFAR